MIGPIRTFEIEQLQPMPASVTRLFILMRDPDTTLADIGRLVELDEALTANILRMANSAWSSSRYEIVTVKQAVVRLGTVRILGIAMARHMAGYMSGPFSGYELAEHELWRHSVAAALAAEYMNQFASETIPGIAFTAALMHDIGKLLLTRYISPDVLIRISVMIESLNFTYLEAEREVLGTDQAEVGCAIARHWHFPEQLVTAIERHHDPDAQPDPVLDTVHVANVVAKLIGVGLGSEQMNMKVSAAAPRRLGITRSGLESLCAMVKEKLAEAEELYGSFSDGN